MISCATLLLVLAANLVGADWHDGSGPWVIATKGEPWPSPNNRQLHDDYYYLQPDSFSFQVMQENCGILVEAIKRYQKIFSHEARVAEKFPQTKIATKVDQINKNGTVLNGLEIHLKKTCEQYPRITSNESYDLKVPAGEKSKIASLTADSIWGILRGLETFSQLVFQSENEAKLVVRGQKIFDQPRLGHRGLLIDTSRHFLPVADILLILDGMVYNKLNVLHWHIVDDNSFPYESAVFPELSAKGSYHPSLTYSLKDMQAVIEYARLRGIRVLPEFDSPGHTQSWGLSHPEFLTQCYDGNGPTGKLGPMNPTREKLYDFMRRLLKEVGERFPDKYVHLGGDEVPFDCWKSNPEINSFMHKYNISQRFEKLEELYIQRVLDVVANLNITPIVWQEVFDNGVRMHEGTVVQVWTGNWRAEMAAVTAAGHPALLSACWYLDHVASGGDWLKYYECDPLDFNYTSELQKSRVLGGEACMWGEFVDKNNVHPRIWPRASAAAERLWSLERQTDAEAAKRLEEHACRMNRRGIPAQPPNGSGFCLS